MSRCNYSRRLRQRLLAVTLAGLGALAGASAVSAGSVSGKKGRASAPVSSPVSVTFSEGCASAEVYSTVPVSEVVALFSNQEFERIGELPRATYYVVRLAPRTAAAGVTITALYVQSGARAQAEPTGVVPGRVGEAFNCQGGASAQTSPHGMTRRPS